MALPIRNSRIQLAQGQLFWREVGNGTVIVFLHGSWHSGDQWLSVMQELGSDYQCLAPDLLGCGESDRPRLKYSIDIEVECLSEYLAALRLRHIYLVGHSLGGWVAASYALKYPDQVKGIVLVAPEGVSSRAKNRWSLDRWLMGQPPWLYWVLSLVHPLAKLLKRHKGIETLLARRQQLRRSRTACRLLFRRRANEIASEHLQSRLEQLTLPILLVQGGRDSKDISGMSALYASLLPEVNVQHVLQSEATNLPELAPEALAREIRLFVTT